jgi:molybdopterin-guanine dinucleotide biosynthesis protein A
VRRAVSDLPFVARDTVADLVAALGTGDAAVLVDDDQRDQPLSAAYGRAALGSRLAALQDLCGVSVRTVLRSMSVTRVSAARAARDCDTWDDVRAARRVLERPR